MSRTPSSDLFDLIKSLTKSEKRLFKLYASRQSIGEKNNYVKLFDAIDKQKEYDEDSLLKHTPWLRKTDFRSMKSYLYELILRSLQPVLRQYSSNAHVVYMTEKALFLTHKRLFKQATRMMQKAKMEAIKAGDLVGGLDILLQQSALKVHLEETNTLERHQQIYRSQCLVLGWLKRNVDYYDLFMRMHYLHLRLHTPHTREEMEELDGIMSSPLLQDEGMLEGSFTRMQFYEVHMRNARLRHDVEGAYRYACKKKTMLEVDPGIRDMHLCEYTYGCASVLTLCVELRRYDEFEEGLEVLRSLYRKGNPYNVDVQACTLYAEFLYLVRRCRFDQATAMIPEIEQFLQRHHEQVEVVVRFDFFIAFAILSTIIGEHRQSLHWTGKMLNYPYIDKYRTLQESSKWLNVINYIELNDDDALESSLRSMHRFLLTDGDLHPLERSLLSFFRQLAAINNSGTMTAALCDLQDAFPELHDTESMWGAIYQFDLMAWLQSKIEGRSLAEVLIEKERLMAEEPVAVPETAEEVCA